MNGRPKPSRSKPAAQQSTAGTSHSAWPVSNLDQRGYVRPGVGAANCFIGAFEANSASPCVGDCNGDGQVTVDEILTMVNIALGSNAGHNVRSRRRQPRWRDHR